MIKIRALSKILLLKQSIFGFPWVLTAVFLALTDSSAFISFRLFLWILLAFMTARSAGMAFNRLIDCSIDRLNPRTKNRALPKGEITIPQVFLVAMLSSLGFIYSAFKINTLAFYLSPLILFLLVFYSYTKRFTYFCHFVLGVIQFFGPVGAWIAMTGTIHLTPILLGLAVLMSITANDMIYAIQDQDFDQKVGLFSIPALFGVKKTLLLAKVLHFFVLIFLVGVGTTLNLNPYYYLGVIAVGIVYLYSYYHLDPKNHLSLFQTFSYCNALSAVVYMVFTISSVILYG